MPRPVRLPRRLGRGGERGCGKTVAHVAVDTDITFKIDDVVEAVER